MSPRLVPQPGPLLLISTLILSCAPRPEPHGPKDTGPKADTEQDTHETGRDTVEDSEHDTHETGKDSGEDTGHDTHETGKDSGEDTGLLACDLATLDPYVEPVFSAVTDPPVPGGPLTLRYRGPLSEGASLIMHYGFNGWELLEGMKGYSSESSYSDALYYIEVPMTLVEPGIFEVTVDVPSSARALHAVFRDDLGNWDSNSDRDYHQSILFPYIGPYLTWNHEVSAEEGIVVNYETSLPCLGVVSHGPSPTDLSHCAVGTELDTLHHVEISGVAPGTTWYYRVHDSQGHSSELFSFTTARDSGEELGEYSFIALSDAQDDGDSNRWEQTASAILDDHSDASFLLFAGDLAFTDNPGYWWIFFDKARALLASRAIMPTPGNHDTPTMASDLDTTSFQRYFDLPYARDGAAHYSFDFESSHFLMLNSEDQPSFEIDAEQYLWAGEDLASCSVGGHRLFEQIFAAWHVPPYNAGGRHQAEQDQVRDATTGFDSVVSFHFSGHEHLYQRMIPLRYNGVEAPSGEYGLGESDGVGYIVLPPTGASPDSALMSPSDPDAHRRDRVAFPVFGETDYTAASELGFVRVDVDGGAFTISTYGLGTSSAPLDPWVRDTVTVGD